MATGEGTLAEVVERWATRTPDKAFIVAECGETTSFCQFFEQVCTAAGAMLGAGAGHGDRIAIWAPNRLEWVVAASAAQMIGAALVPINTRFKGTEAGFVLARTGAKLLFTTRAFLGIDYVNLLERKFGGAQEGRPIAGLPKLERIILIGDDRATSGVIDWQGFNSIVPAPDELGRARALVNPDTIADILFTSGTTGEPKGAMHSHAQAIWGASNINDANGLRADDRMLVVNPFFHSFGYRAGWCAALLAGMTLYPMAVFDPVAISALVERERITVLMGPPTLFEDLLAAQQRDPRDLSSLRIGHTGASSSAADMIRRARTELGYDALLTSYGMTETSALVTSNRVGDSLETITTTVGKAVPGVELRTIDGKGRDLGPSEAGELLVRGPNVMKGYLDDPAATAAAIDAAGWLHTGDVAMILESGHVRIIDRLKDVVIVGGFNVYPAEVERVLAEHPAIAEVVIVGAPDARLGEVCASCVVLRDGHSLTLAELREWASERIANFKVPRHLIIRDALPRTALGKPQKFILKAETAAMAKRTT